MTFGKRLGGALVAGALLATAFAPSTFAADLEISGNGAGSDNTIEVKSESECNVTQTSNTNVEAIVGASASTGGNTANNNTGGSVQVNTGNATATASLTVVGGSNTATDPCCCQSGCNECNGCENGHSATISGNGVESDNDIKVTKKKSSSIRQRAKTYVSALVAAKAKTGKNQASSNTGGNVGVDTGAGDATADVLVEGGSNSINP